MQEEVTNGAAHQIQEDPLLSREDAGLRDPPRELGRQAQRDRFLPDHPA
jgi:hypothetical protein